MNVCDGDTWPFRPKGSTFQSSPVCECVCTLSSKIKNYEIGIKKLKHFVGNREEKRNLDT